MGQITNLTKNRPKSNFFVNKSRSIRFHALQLRFLGSADKLRRCKTKMHPLKRKIRPKIAKDTIFSRKIGPLCGQKTRSYELKLAYFLRLSGRTFL